MNSGVKSESIWNDPANAETAIRLWAEGFSATAIAVMLGAGVSRNAVLGKLLRLGVLKTRRPVKISARAKRAAARMESSVPPPPGAATHLLNLGVRECHFPLWDDSERPTMQYCGAESAAGAPYCEFHRRKMWVSAKAAAPAREKAKAAAHNSGIKRALGG